MLLALTSVPAYVLSPGAVAPQLLQQQRQLSMMAKKKKVDDRVWLPKRTSEFGREVDVARMPEPDVETLEASMRALRAEIERRERRRGKRLPRPGARRIFGDVKNRVA